jgi:hypothetical protein
MSGGGVFAEGEKIVIRGAHRLCRPAWPNREPGRDALRSQAARGCYFRRPNSELITSFPLFVSMVIVSCWGIRNGWGSPGSVTF